MKHHHHEKHRSKHQDIEKSNGHHLHSSQGGSALLTLGSVMLALGVGFMFKKEIMQLAHNLKNCDAVQNTVHRAYKWMEKPEEAESATAA